MNKANSIQKEIERHEELSTEALDNAEFWGAEGYTNVAWEFEAEAEGHNAAIASLQRELDAELPKTYRKETV